MKYVAMVTNIIYYFFPESFQILYGGCHRLKRQNQRQPIIEWIIYIFSLYADLMWCRAYRSPYMLLLMGYGLTFFTCPWMCKISMKTVHFPQKLLDDPHPFPHNLWAWLSYKLNVCLNGFQMSRLISTYLNVSCAFRALALRCIYNVVHSEYL